MQTKIDSNNLRQDSTVRIKAELLHGKFIALAKIVSRHDLQAVVGNNHPTFELLEDIG